MEVESALCVSESDNSPYLKVVYCERRNTLVSGGRALSRTVCDFTHTQALAEIEPRLGSALCIKPFPIDEIALREVNLRIVVIRGRPLQVVWFVIVDRFGDSEWELRSCVPESRLSEKHVVLTSSSLVVQAHLPFRKDSHLQTRRKPSHCHSLGRDNKPTAPP